MQGIQDASAHAHHLDHIFRICLFTAFNKRGPKEIYCNNYIICISVLYLSLGPFIISTEEGMHDH